MKLRPLAVMVFTLWSCLLVGATEDPVPVSGAEVKQVSLWSNLVVIGASVSDGYDRREPIGGVESEKLSLENYLNQLIKEPQLKITNFGNKFFFMNPQNISKKQVEQALELKPSVVLAPDFLFWLVYGTYQDEDARVRSLVQGLKLLDSFECPMVLGNIPDASKAIYKMLAPSQIPQKETMRVANRVIRDWVKMRKNVVIMDNESFMRNSHANTEIKLKYTTIPTGQTQGLLQSDFLHPTIKGARAVCVALLECLLQKTNFPNGDVDWQAGVSPKPDGDKQVAKP